MSSIADVNVKTRIEIIACARNGDLYRTGNGEYILNIVGDELVHLGSGLRDLVNDMWYDGTLTMVGTDEEWMQMGVGF